VTGVVCPKKSKSHEDNRTCRSLFLSLALVAVLVVATTTATGEPTLHVFDAATLTERARAPLPQHEPFGFHGRFFSDR